MGHIGNAGHPERPGDDRRRDQEDRRGRQDGRARWQTSGNVEHYAQHRRALLHDRHPAVDRGRREGLHGEGGGRREEVGGGGPSPTPPPCAGEGLTFSRSPSPAHGGGVWGRGLLHVRGPRAALLRCRAHPARCASQQEKQAPTMVELGYKLSSEEHSPNDLDQRRAARRRGRLQLRDDLRPLPSLDRQAGRSRRSSGASSAASRRSPGDSVVTGVTCPIVRIHPAIIAQAAATVGALLPGRFMLGVGTGENLNEHILGDRWPRRPCAGRCWKRRSR